MLLGAYRAALAAVAAGADASDARSGLAWALGVEAKEQRRQRPRT